MVKRTCLYYEHKKLGAKFTEFSGWEMPVQYSSVIDEHNAVRTNAGVFDTAHMGTFLVSGDNAEKFLNFVTLGNISGLYDKKARYSMILNKNGGIKDDIIVYRLSGKLFMLVVNAGNLEKDFNWLNEQIIDKVKIKNISNEICLISVQGPRAVYILQNISKADIVSMKYFTLAEFKIKNIDAKFCKLARTGYTGEDGFEIFISKEQVFELWEKLMQFSVTPCGLGCRDTLRLEACMPLHGHEIDECINPIEAGFQETINWDNDFIGKKQLLSIKNKPLRKLIAFECVAGIARNASEFFFSGKKIGYVTSGSFSPTLKKSIGMALVESTCTSNILEVEIRNSMRKINVVSKPFYKRNKV